MQDLGVGDKQNRTGAQKFDRIDPAVTIEFDTYDNGIDMDPAYDHTNLFFNGDIATTALSAPYATGMGNGLPTIHETKTDVEDADTLDVSIIVTTLAGVQTLELWVDGSNRFNYTGDIINDIFSGESKVIGGFTSSTGGANNDQFVILDPNFGEYDFAWKDETNVDVGSSNPFLCNVGPGDYTITVTNSRTGCVSDTETFTVPDGTDAIDAEIIIDQQPQVCDGAVGTPNGQLTATINNPDGGSYIFNWYAGADTTGAKIQTDSVFTIDPSMPAKSSTIDSLPEGAYTVVVLDFLDPSKHCFSIVSTTLVNQKPTLVVGGTSNPVTNCTTMDNGSYEVTSITEDGSAADVANYEFDLYDNLGTFVKTSTLATITGLSESNYSIVPINALTGCEFPAKNFSIGSNYSYPTATPDVAGTNDNTVCDQNLTTSGNYNGKITLTLTSIATDFIYTWYQGTSTDASDALTNDGSSAISGTDTSSTANTLVLDNIPKGTYTVMLTSKITGCSANLEFSIDETLTKPSIGSTPTSSPETVCGNGSAPYPNGGITVDLASITGTGSYTYRYYYGLLVDPLMLIDDVSSIFDQKGTAGAGLAQNVSGSMTNQISGLDEGAYTVVVIDNGTGCISAKQNVTIDSSPSTLAIEVDTFGDNTVCDFSLTSEYNGFIHLTTTDASSLNDYDYEWYQGQNTDAANAINTAKVATADIATDGQLNELPSGTYTVVITDPVSGCTLKLEKEIDNDFTDIPLIAGATPTDVDVCSGNGGYPNGSITLDPIIGGSGSYSYEWYYGGSVNAGKKLTDAATIFTQKGISGTSSVNVSGATTISIGNLNPGSYTVRVLDVNRGCYSAARTFPIGTTPNGLAFNPFTNVQDNYTCNTSSPIGAATANATGTATPQYEWYKGTSATGTPVLTETSATSTASGLLHGTYTVKYTNLSTSCFITSQVVIEEFNPTVTIVTNVDNNQTNCDPNGAVSVTSQSIAFTPVGVPAGFVAPGTFDYKWYFGPGITTPLVEGVDPGNGSNPTGVLSSTLSNLAAGQYTVVVTETQSGCVSAQETVTVIDLISANAPDLEFFITLQPNSCLAVGTFQARLASNLSGNTFDFEFYEGAQDYAKLNALGDGLVTGDELVSNPGTPLTITNTAGSAAPGVFANNQIANAFPGLYTIVVTDQSTGCRYQEYFELTYLNQQATTTVTIKNISGCPDNGTAKVGLEDDPSNPGRIENDVDDISEYILYLYAGNGVPSDRLAAYDYEGIRFPLSYVAESGNIFDGDGALITNSAVLNRSDTAIFNNLPEGPYIAVAREKSNPAFNPLSTSQCWSSASFDEEIYDLADEPIITATTEKNNTNCVGVGNGELSITVIEDPSENTNPVVLQQPSGYRFTWLRLLDNVIVHTEDRPNETETSVTPDTLSSGQYEVTIERLGGLLGASNGCAVVDTLEVVDNPIQHYITNATVVDFNNCDADPASTITIANADITDDASDYTYQWFKGGTNVSNDITSTASIGNGASIDLSASGLTPIADTYFVIATRTGSGCVTTAFEIDIADNTVDIAVNLTVDTEDNSCLETDDDGLGIIDFTITSPTTGSYDFAWFTDSGLSQPVLGSATGISGSVAGLLIQDV